MMSLTLSALEAIEQRWAWALVHFVWQGFLVAGLGALVLLALRNSTPQLRYASALTAQLLCFAAPFLTAASYQSREHPQPVAQLIANDALPIRADDNAAVANPTSDPRPALAQSPIRAAAHGAAFFRSWQTVVVAAWICGVFALGLRMLLGYICLLSLRRTSVAAPRNIIERASQLAQRIGLKALPAIAISATVTEGVALGFLRPLILLPTPWLTALRPEMLDAVLAHELAHLRRHDLWVNLLQRIIEIVLFYHPAVWWLSSRVRQERELCCDAIAIRATESPRDFAVTLETLATMRLGAAKTTSQLVINFGDQPMRLMQRVQAVLGIDRRGATCGLWPLSVIALAIPLFWLVEGFGSLRAANPPDKIGVVTAKSSSDAGKPVPTAAHANARPYTIEPPDILVADIEKLVPKAPYHLEPFDSVQISFLSGLPEAPLTGKYTVGPSGMIDLGSAYKGKIKLGGLTDDEAEKALIERLKSMFTPDELAESPPTVSFIPSQTLSFEQKELLVAPDGTIRLGILGSVPVAGKTLDEATAALKLRLSEKYADPKVSLDVFAYNSKVYYVIINGGDEGDSVIRVPCTGNETVLDAIAQIDPKSRPKRFVKSFIARPQRTAAGDDEVIPFDINKVTASGLADELKIYPGDRVMLQVMSREGAQGLDAVDRKSELERLRNEELWLRSRLDDLHGRIADLELGSTESKAPDKSPRERKP